MIEILNTKEGGYTIKAYMPENEKEEQQLIAEIYNGAEKISVLRIPMKHKPTFGPHVEDIEHMNKMVHEELDKMS